MGINETLSSIKESIYSYVPSGYHVFFPILVYTILIALYAVFIWKFYRFLARRDIIKLNLAKYNTIENPGWYKFGATLLFFLEYLIIIPLLIFFWFAILSIFLLVLSKNQSVTQILLIASAIVGATRLAAYISEDLSKDLAKMFPFTLLAIFLVDPNFFSFQEIITRFFEIPSLIQVIFIYLIFLFILEIIIRGAFTIKEWFSSEKEVGGEKNIGNI